MAVKNTKKTVICLSALCAVAAAMVLSVGAVGCGGGDNGTNPNGGNGGNPGGNPNGGAVTLLGVEVGTQIWTAKNLNIKTADSWCYNDSAANCEKYGRLYTWAAALTVCPKDWHLPESWEWSTLFSSNSGFASNYPWRLLSRYGGWGDMHLPPSVNNFEIDYYGFSALPAGYWIAREYGGVDGYFTNVGSSARWWTATEGTYLLEGHEFYGTDASAASISTRGAGVGDNFSKTDRLSVRCVHD